MIISKINYSKASNTITLGTSYGRTKNWNGKNNKEKSC